MASRAPSFGLSGSHKNNPIFRFSTHIIENKNVTLIYGEHKAK